MNRRKLSTAIAVIFATLTVQPEAANFAYAQAAAVPFLADMAVSDVVWRTKEAAKEVLTTASAGVSRNSFEIRQSIEILIQLLDRTADGLIGKTFGQLNESQRLAFANINASLQNLRDASRQTIKDANETVSLANDLLGTIPFAYRSPRVLKFSPAYVGATSESAGPVAFTVQGSWLGNGTPRLTFGPVECTRIVKTESSLTFACPRRLFRPGDKVEYRSAELTVVEPKSFWERLGSIFSKQDKTRTYTVSTFIVPMKMGSYAVRAIVADTSPEWASRQSQGFYHRNGHCEGARELVWTVNRTEGWKIDSSSVVVHETTKNGDTVNYGVRNVSETGFQLGGLVRNEGSCGPFWKDARGWLGVFATYREYRDVRTERTVDVEQGDVIWGKDVSVSLPVQTQAFRLEVAWLDGSRSVDVEPRAERRWYSVLFDQQSHELVLRPKEMNTALQ